jgi:hypothetical protein
MFTFDEAPKGVNVMIFYDFHQFLAENFCTQLQNFIPWYENLYPVTKLHTLVWKFVPSFKTTYLGMKIRTQLQNYLPGHETSYLGAKLVHTDKPTSGHHDKSQFRSQSALT